MQKCNYRAKFALGVAISAILVGCATGPDILSAPNGSNRTPVNSDQAVKDYAAAVVKTGQLDAENRRLALFVKVMDERLNELTNYIIGKAAADSINAPKGWPAKPDSQPNGAAAVVQVRPPVPNVVAAVAKLQEPISVPSALPKQAASASPTPVVRQSEVVMQAKEPAQVPLKTSTPPTASVFAVKGDEGLLETLERWAEIAGFTSVQNSSARLPLPKEVKAFSAPYIEDAVLGLLRGYQEFSKSPATLRVKVDNASKTLVAKVVGQVETLPQQSVAALKVETNLAQSSPKTTALIEEVKTYGVLDSDASLVSLLIRWAEQSGYAVNLNGVAVTSSTLKNHPVKYFVPEMIPAMKGFSKSLTFQEAVSAIAAAYGPYFKQLTPPPPMFAAYAKKDVKTLFIQTGTEAPVAPKTN